MRGYRKAGLVAICALTVFALGCTTKPIYNVTGAPVVANKPSPTLAEVGSAIQRAGAGLGWQMMADKPGHMLGRLQLRGHEAVVDVNYTPKTYSITYNNSTNLNYDGTTIHNNYNGWVQNLDKAIRTQLTLIQ